VLEYLIDAANVRSGAAVYLKITLYDPDELTGIQTILDALRLK